LGHAGRVRDNGLLERFLERVRQFTCRAVTQLAVLLKCLKKYSLDRAGQARIDIARRRWRFGDMLDGHTIRRLSLKGPHPRQHLEQHHPQGIQVTTTVQIVTLGLLR